MKRNLLFMVSLIFILIVAGCSQSDEPGEFTASVPPAASNEDTLDESETKKDLTWTDFSLEQKEEKVNEKLEENQLDGYPPNKIIEKLDYLYENAGYTMEDFDNAFNGVLQSLNQLQIEEVVFQFGDDSFTDLGKTKIEYVFEEDDKVYVLFRNSSGKGPKYLSVAESGKWVVRDLDLFPNGISQGLKEIGKNPNDFAMQIARFYYYKNHMYITASPYRAEETIFLENKISDTGVTEVKPLEYPYDHRYALYLETNTGKPAIMQKNEDMYEVYFIDDFSEPVLTFKPTDLFSEKVEKASYSSFPAYLDFDNEYLLIADSGFSLLDVENGDLFWNARGEEKISALAGKYRAFNLVTIENYANNLITITDYETNSIAKYNPELGMVGEKLILPEELDRDFKQTMTQDEIHIWQPVSFKGTQSLQLIRISKGIDGYRLDDQSTETD